MEATVTYNNRSQPTKILVSYQGAKVAELQINERTDQDIEIVPLENKLDFQDILDGIDLEKLMDELPLDATEVEPD